LLKGKARKKISFNVSEAYTIRNIKENIQEMEDIGPLNQAQSSGIASQPTSSKYLFRAIWS